jgi:hypothetical protein
MVLDSIRTPRIPRGTDSWCPPLQKSKDGAAFGGFHLGDPALRTVRGATSKIFTTGSTGGQRTLGVLAGLGGGRCGDPGRWGAGPTLHCHGRGCPILDVLGRGWARCCQESGSRNMVLDSIRTPKIPRGTDSWCPPLQKNARMGQPQAVVIHGAEARGAGQPPELTGTLECA